ncbi:hypothetical protein HME01_22440 [Vreelandella aquamarina]|nr:hypothetical protein HME01_22440 [Halomonas meridiana]
MLSTPFHARWPRGLDSRKGLPSPMGSAFPSIRHEKWHMTMKTDAVRRQLSLHTPFDRLKRTDQKKAINRFLEGESFDSVARKVSQWAEASNKKASTAANSQ